MTNTNDHPMWNTASWNKTFKNSLFESKQTTNEVTTNENDETVVTVSVIGHHPDNIDVEVLHDKLHISASKRKNSSSLVEDIKLEYIFSENLDPKPVSATVELGILTIVFKRYEKKEKKSKKIKLNQ